MDHSSLFKENSFSSEGKKKVNQLFETKILNDENNLLTPTKNGRPKIGKELYGVTKQKLTDSNPTEGPSIGLHPRIVINQVVQNKL